MTQTTGLLHNTKIVANETVQSVLEIDFECHDKVNFFSNGNPHFLLQNQQ